MKTVTLLGRAGCHLCDDAREVVLAVAGRAGASVTELDVDDDPELRAEYGDMVPVVLIDGIQHGYYTVDPDRLARALAS
jgi:glutaredoxin